MALIVNQPVMAFDPAEVRCGYLLWGRHRTWHEGKAGIVTSATADQLTVQYYPDIGNVTNHFFIPASEAAKGEWEIRYSPDLSCVKGYGIQTDGGREGIKEDEFDVTGGVDL